MGGDNIKSPEEIMKNNYVVIETTVVYDKTPAKVVWGGSYESCEKFCEKQDHYHSIYDIDTWYKPQGGYYRIHEIL